MPASAAEAFDCEGRASAKRHHPRSCERPIDPRTGMTRGDSWRSSVVREANL
jgi:hypothetical protein